MFSYLSCNRFYLSPLYILFRNYDCWLLLLLIILNSGRFFYHDIWANLYCRWLNFFLVFSDIKIIPNFLRFQNECLIVTVLGLVFGWVYEFVSTSPCGFKLMSLGKALFSIRLSLLGSEFYCLSMHDPLLSSNFLLLDVFKFASMVEIQ